jgi:YfiH family protein
LRITSDELKLVGVTHGFFTREGGVSQGIFASLNCGLGSGDDVALVTENRARVQAELGAAALVSAYQVHGVDVAVVTGPFEERPKVDAMVSATPGVAIGVLTADCGPVLFADEKAKVVGACHAGWKGALLGVTDATIIAMEKLGARRENIVAILGPTISQANYEVGPEFPKPFLADNPQAKAYFTPSVKKDHHMFDLPRFLVDRMKRFGVGTVADLGLCTYAEEDWFFSYRRATHRAEKDYGRLISAIGLTA